MSDCIFCKIVKKEIPANVIYENDKIVAFLDIMPVNKGHTLIVPKSHSADLTEINDEDAVEIMIKAKEFGDKIMQAVEADGFNISINIKPAAGQAVMHTHVHIIPRFKGDGLRAWPSKKLSREELANVKNKIVTFLKE